MGDEDAANFLAESNPRERAERISDLVQFLLSIDEQTTFIGLPGTGAAGGSLCPAVF